MTRNPAFDPSRTRDAQPPTEPAAERAGDADDVAAVLAETLADLVTNEPRWRIDLWAGDLADALAARPAAVPDHDENLGVGNPTTADIAALIDEVEAARNLRTAIEALHRWGVPAGYVGGSEIDSSAVAVVRYDELCALFAADTGATT